MHVGVMMAIPVAAALSVSLFFVGANIIVLSVTLGLLITALIGALWRGYRDGVSIPRSALVLSLLLFWGWLALTVLWTPVTFVSVTMFWWLSSLPLAFWFYTLLPARERAWRYQALLLLLVGGGASFHGVYQHFVLGIPPTSLFLDINIHAALLNLIALSTCGYFLLFQLPERKNNRYAALLGAAFVFLVYVLMLTRSRGGILAFLLCASWLLWVAFRYVPRRAILISMGLIIVGYAFADLSWQGGLTERAKSLLAPSLSDPSAVGTARLSIWRNSWRLLFDQSPLVGVGLGLYSLVWPPYHQTTDDSAGYFVHNDYLQIWIETGFPGLLLFLALLTSVAWTVWCTLTRLRVTGPVRIEMAGIFAALAATASHSFVQYNFYIIPILLICGLLLGRLQELTMLTPALAPGAWKIEPARFFTPTGYRLIVLVLALLPLGYFVSIGVSTHQLARGNLFAAQGSFDEADQAFMVAQRFWSDSDAPLIARAGLYRAMLAHGGGNDEQRRALFQSGEALLVEAERLNPLRPDIFTIRAEIYRQAPSFAGSGWSAKVEDNYRQALALNPWHYRARYGYAQFLFAQNREPEARNIMEERTRYR